MSILKNAVESIQLGVEDAQSHDPKRVISSVRNFYAGVLLLFKHKLAVLSKDDDEALIKQKILPKMDGKRVKWKGEGKKTVDVPQIRERFESLSIDVDWKRLKAVQDYRNDIEHYHSKTHPSAARQYLTDCFVVVRDFIVNQLKEDPRRLLGDTTWEFLVQEQAVYEAERKACTDAMDSLVWPNDTAKLWLCEGRCPECSSDLLRPIKSSETAAEDKRFECAVCAKRWDYEGLLSAVGSPHDTFQAARDGGGQVVGICPDCGNEGYDGIESECVFCGATGPFECDRCGHEIPIEEMGYDNSSLCGYCAHVMSKDD